MLQIAYVGQNVSPDQKSVLPVKTVTLLRHTYWRLDAISYRSGLSHGEDVSVFGTSGVALAPTAAARNGTSSLILLSRIGKPETLKSSKNFTRFFMLCLAH